MPTKTAGRKSRREGQFDALGARSTPVLKDHSRRLSSPSMRPEIVTVNVVLGSSGASGMSRTAFP